MLKLKWIAITIAVLLIVTLLLQNTEPVETRVLFTSFVMPRAVLLFVTAALGFLCGVILTLMLIKKDSASSR